MIVEDVEGLGVSAEHQGAAHHVQAVDRQRLSRDQPANQRRDTGIGQYEAGIT